MANQLKTSHSDMDITDTTNLTKDKRLPFIEAIKKEIPNANIQYKLMELNPELAKQRIKAQLARGENRANVSDATIDRHAESYKQMLIDIKSEPISEYKELNQTSKTRRILEVQSDLFQKGRGKQDLVKFTDLYDFRANGKQYHLRGEALFEENEYSFKSKLFFNKEAYITRRLILR